MWGQSSNTPFLKSAVNLSLISTEAVNLSLISTEAANLLYLKKLEVFGGHLLSEDDHSHWALPYWNIMKETFLWVELNSKSNCKNCQLRVSGMFIKK